MHHKRGRAKNARAGCRMCKPNKFGHGLENQIGHRGFGAHLRREINATLALKERDDKLQPCDSCGIR